MKIGPNYDVYSNQISLGAYFMTIGKAIANSFAAEGANIAILDTNLEAAEQVAAGIRQAGGSACAVQ